MTGRVIAVGDIHGCSKAFATLIEAINLRADDTFIGLGTTSTGAPIPRVCWIN